MSRAPKEVSAVSETRSVPTSRVSMPEFVDWHMILDAELSQLSAPETGVLGSVGFTALGGALGLLPLFMEAKEKLGVAPMGTQDFVYACSFVGCLVLAIICLVIFGIRRSRNYGLAARIRNRPVAKA